MRQARRTGLAAALALLFALAGANAALANGIGDLYAATGGGVLELHVQSARVVNTVPMAPAPDALAFTPDGHVLYTASGRHVTPIDIASLDVGASIPLTSPAAALAFPSGQSLVIAMPGVAALGILRLPGATVAMSAALPAGADLLAGDRHDPRVVAARRGSNWFAVLDPATGELRLGHVTGSVTAIAIDRDRDGAYVATSKPAALVRVNLSTLAATWQAALPAPAVGVAATSTGVVAGAGTTIWTVAAGGAKRLATTHAPIVALVASDEGQVVHAAEATAVEAFGLNGVLDRTVGLGAGREPVAIAAVPAGSSLFTGTAATGQQGAAAATGMVAPPVTSTVLAAASSALTHGPLGVALLVALAILALFAAAIRWYALRSIA